MTRATRARIATLALPLLGTLACGGKGTEPLVVTTVTVDAASSTIEVSATTTVAATAKDQNGGSLGGRSATWSSGNLLIATVSTVGLVTGIAPGVTTITAVVDGKIASTQITVIPIPVAAVVVAPLPTSLEVNAVGVLSAVTKDRSGNTLTGRTVTWSSATPAVATVNSSGVVTGVVVGSSVISATSEGVTGTSTVTIVPIPVASVTVTALPGALVAGTTSPLTVVTRDRNSALLTGRTITYASGSTSVATIDASGVVTAVAAGSAVITATSEGISGTTTVTVVAGGVTVSAVTPSPLVPGSAATITGSNFSTVTTQNAVTISGTAATVLSATATQLTVTVPCVKSGSSAVRVTTASVTSTVLTTSVSVPQRTVALGQALVLTTSSASACNELVVSGSQRYVVAVFSASTSVSSLFDFSLTGNPAASVAQVPVVAMLRNSSPARGPETAEAARDRAHFQLLERDRSQYESQMSRWRGARTRIALRDPTPLPALGATRNFFYTFSAGCNDVSNVINGKAIYVGTKAIIWEDAANAVQSTTDANLAGYYQRLGQIFDQDQYDVVKRNFGDPLLRDADTDGDGRVHMIFTARLNGSGAAAFVTSCDQFPTSISPGSNFGQFFYGFVPVTSTLNINSSNSPDGWFNFMARTVVHEVKHIASLSARVANNAPTFEQSWLEEGTARHAEEIWTRESLHKVAWKGNTSYGGAVTNQVYCDFHGESAICNSNDVLRRPSYGVRRHFNEILDKLVTPWDWSPYGSASGQSGSVFYQTAWSLVRYTIDRYGASDAAFLTALTNAQTNGMTNLTAVAGASADQLIGGWGLALYADDYPGLASPGADLQFPTWNMRGIYGGLNADPSWSFRFTTPYPVTPVALTFGSFSNARPGLRAGAHEYYELSGSLTGTQLLAISALTGGAPSANLRIAIARLQ